jgi:sarcosine oxidase/L-pipecolate oxidase
MGAEGRYNESGLLLVTGAEQNRDYVEKSFQNISTLLQEQGVDVKNKLELLPDREAIRRVAKTGGVPGSRGYVNWTSGWADAEESMKFVRATAQKRPNIQFLVGTVSSVVENNNGVQGVRLEDGRILKADLTVLATGAWTPSLLLDLNGRATATGQVLGYLELSDEEEERLRGMPVTLDLSNGKPYPTGSCLNRVSIRDADNQKACS